MNPMDDAKELEILRVVVRSLQEGSVGNQAVWESVNNMPTNQSDWGRLIAQKALDIAMRDAIDTLEERSNEK